MAEEGPKPKKKRRVRDPETFRERAVKAAEAKEADRSKSRRGRQRIRKTSGIIGVAAKPLKRLARFKAARAVGKVLVPAYFRNSFRELKLVTWPGWKQSRQLTFAVLVFAIIFAALISAVDYGLNKVFKSILLN